MSKSHSTATEPATRTSAIDKFKVYLESIRRRLNAADFWAWRFLTG
ncbi:MAG TPA: hypothetical protein VHK27_06800 [Gammaproteobacteria bacterium]|nr:hypothetical protein [Gammaproteobacteria bacterium]